MRATGYVYEGRVRMSRERSGGRQEGRKAFAEHGVYADGNGNFRRQNGVQWYVQLGKGLLKKGFDPNRAFSVQICVFNSW